METLHKKILNKIYKIRKTKNYKNLIFSIFFFQIKSLLLVTFP